jgi:hypothetical protein
MILLCNITGAVRAHFFEVYHGDTQGRVFVYLYKTLPDNIPPQPATTVE